MRHRRLFRGSCIRSTNSVIGIPMIGIAKMYLRKIFDNIELEEGLENFLID